MRYTILIVAIGLIFLGCKKNSNTRPVLSYKSVNSTTIENGELLIFTLSFKDIAPSQYNNLVIKEIVPCPLSAFSDTVALPVFSAPSNQGGDITVSFINNTIAGSYPIIAAKCDSDDIANFQFTLIDKNQHKSDSILSPTIIIKQ
jgi:uncharacterized repeat protein (TIGR01451 family)